MAIAFHIHIHFLLQICELKDFFFSLLFDEERKTFICKIFDCVKRIK